MLGDIQIEIDVEPMSSLTSDKTVYIKHGNVMVPFSIKEIGWASISGGRMSRRVETPNKIILRAAYPPNLSPDNAQSYAKDAASGLLRNTPRTRRRLIQLLKQFGINIQYDLLLSTINASHPEIHNGNERMLSSIGVEIDDEEDESQKCIIAQNLKYVFIVVINAEKNLHHQRRAHVRVTRKILVVFVVLLLHP